MLRVGLTGGMGSGKSTVAQMFAKLGAYVFSADEIGRELMQPDEAVYAAIVTHFGPSVVTSDGMLDRPALARIAFGDGSAGSGRVEELNAIVHPAVIARQVELIDEIAARDAEAVVIVESALIFETKYGGEGGCQSRFDKLLFVRAPELLRIERFVARASVDHIPLTEEARRALEAEARRRMAKQIDDEEKAAQCDYILTNDGSLDLLRAQVEWLWPNLQEVAKAGK
jgi:dephospho-CoA kinase